MNSSDNIISRFLILIIVAVIGYWAVLGGIWVWDWYFRTGGYTADWWPRLGAFLWRNIGIVMALYGIACVQASGVAELKFRKNFLVALLLAFLLTPPLMMGVYGRRTQA